MIIRFQNTYRFQNLIVGHSSCLIYRRHLVIDIIMSICTCAMDDCNGYCIHQLLLTTHQHDMNEWYTTLGKLLWVSWGHFWYDKIEGIKIWWSYYVCSSYASFIYEMFLNTVKYASSYVQWYLWQIIMITTATHTYQCLGVISW